MALAGLARLLVLVNPTLADEAVVAVRAHLPRFTLRRLANAAWACSHFNLHRDDSAVGASSLEFLRLFALDATLRYREFNGAEPSICTWAAQPSMSSSSLSDVENSVASLAGVLADRTYSLAGELEPQ